MNKNTLHNISMERTLKKNTLLSGMLFCVLAISSLFLSCSTPPQPGFEVKNESNAKIILTSANLKEFNLPSGTVPLIKNSADTIVPVQLIREVEDTVVYFRSDIAPGTTKVFSYEPVRPEELPAFNSYVQVYLGLLKADSSGYESIQEHKRPAEHKAHNNPFLYQFEGPGWENDLIAFRHYFDERNGRDIFGKIGSELVLQRVGINENYHELQKWGMDVLKVGNSVGAGALGIIKNDTVYRLGHTEDARVEIVHNGPLLAKLKFNYRGWVIDSDSLNVQEYITIEAGNQYFKSEITLEGGDASDTLVTGFPNLKGVPLSTAETPNGWAVAYSHGPQSENNDILGMAIATPQNNFLTMKTVDDTEGTVSNSYLTLLKPDNGIYTFLFLAGWEKSNVNFKNEDLFREHLLQEVEKASNNTTVTFTK